MKTVWLAVRELKRKKLFSALLFAVCTAAMYAVLSAVTNSTATVYQSKIFRENIAVDMDRVLRLDYHSSRETEGFAGVIQQYLRYIESIPGVQSVGQFDMTGMYFLQLKDNEKYMQINKPLVKDTKYENYPAITQLLCADESVLGLFKDSIGGYEKYDDDCLPLYAGQVFEDILPLGTSLTDERTGQNYKIAGYIPRNSMWADENDLIRFPLISLDGCFIAPVSRQGRQDIITQLSMLHNTYIFLEDDADVKQVKKRLSSWPRRYGFSASANLLSEEYRAYTAETDMYTKVHIFLALFVLFMAEVCVISAFMTNILLKKKRYGIFMANGFTHWDMAAEMLAEIMIISTVSGVVSWITKLIQLKIGDDMFKNILLAAHVRFTLPVCAGAVLVVAVVSAFLPSVKILKYQPARLTGGVNSGD